MDFLNKAKAVLITLAVMIFGVGFFAIAGIVIAIVLPVAVFVIISIIVYALIEADRISKQDEQSPQGD